MTFKTPLCFCAVLIALSASAQDKIYKTNGQVIEAKVKAIDKATISYKRFDNPDGPVYTISKKDATRIIYENGTVDNFEITIAPPHRHSNGMVSNGKPFKRYGGDNILTFIPAAYTVALIDGSMNDPGIGICYERVLDERGHISFSLPVMLNFLQDKDFTSNFYSGNYIGNPSSNYHAYMFMPGVKFYPADGAQKTRYGLGIALFALFGSEPYSVYDYSGNPPVDGDWHYTMYGIMFSNSLNMSISPHFYIEFDINSGLPFSDNRWRDKQTLDNLASPMLQFVLKIGSRF